MSPILLDILDDLLDLAPRTAPRRVKIAIGETRTDPVDDTSSASSPEPGEKAEAPQPH
jgi:hypothetical protein